MARRIQPALNTVKDMANQLNLLEFLSLDTNENTPSHQERPLQEDNGAQGVVYGNKEDAAELAKKFETLTNKLSPPTSPDDNPHEGVLLNNQLQTASSVLGVPIYLHGRQWLEGEELGSGMSSTVCKGQDQITNKEYAVKRVPLEDYRALEGVAWAQLRHPNIPELYGIVREENIVYFFCEEIKCGRKLDEYLSSGECRGMSSEQMLSFVNEVDQQVSGAVNHIHERSFSHNDVHPTNVIVDKNRKVWVVDLGDALPVDDEGRRDDDGVRMDMLSVGKVVDRVKQVYYANHGKQQKGLPVSAGNINMPKCSGKQGCEGDAGDFGGLSEAAATVASSRSTDVSETENTIINEAIIASMRDMRIQPKDRKPSGDAPLGPTLKDHQVATRRDDRKSNGKGGGDRGS